MLALSVRQPWAELIVCAKKPIEIRTWWPRLQLPVLVAIHAGKQPATDVRLRIWEQAGFDPAICITSIGERNQMLRLGGIVGVARYAVEDRGERYTLADARAKAERVVMAMPNVSGQEQHEIAAQERAT